MKELRRSKVYLIGRSWAWAAMVMPLLDVASSEAQCPTTVTNFPYNEGFETEAAWTSGGIGNDWAWGTPAHPLINSAGGGTKSWSVGGLTGTFYNSGEQSWLESPCFDFSTLEFPWISFKIFWECEQQYDGAGFQYSLDQGVSWANVGSANSTPDCLTQNWFNSSFVNGLNMASPKHGWSGRVGATVGPCFGGEGSGAWVTASHCITELAGEPSVKFRVIFGAGTTCNNYDGIAIDDIHIGEAQSNSATFNYSCLGTTVEFQNASALCPSSILWNFGDPASGPANTSTLPEPSHTFPGPGTYQVSLTVAGPCNATSTTVIPISIITVDLDGSDPSCAGNDGSITATVTGANAGLVYNWTPSATNAATITGLGAGSYSVVVEGADICPSEASITLVQQDDPLIITTDNADISCNGLADGWITLNVSGGSGIYSYEWSPPAEDSNSINGLSAGTYSVEVSDTQNCTGSVSVTIAEPAELLVNAPPSLALCNGSSIQLQTSPTGGTPPYTITYSPSGPEVSPSISTSYSISITDANGCTAPPEETTVNVGGPAEPTITVDRPTGCAPHCVTMSSSGTGTFAWDLGDGTIITGGSSLDHCFQAGIHDVAVVVTDALGCTNRTILTSAVSVSPSPVASFTAYPPITTIEKPEIQFIQEPSSANTWIWTVDNEDEPVSTAFSPIISFPDIGCYTVDLWVVNDQGCEDTASVEVCVEDEFVVFAPNAFTPNNDGLNDVFIPVTSVRSPSYYQLEIFDRWGQRIHVSSSQDEGWDGSSRGVLLPAGIYVWSLRMRDTLGASQERKGHVGLIR